MQIAGSGLIRFVELGQAQQNVVFSSASGSACCQVESFIWSKAGLIAFTGIVLVPGWIGLLHRCTQIFQSACAIFLHQRWRLLGNRLVNIDNDLPEESAGNDPTTLVITNRELNHVHGIENAIIEMIRSWFDAVGWLGVVVAMAIESACIPLPSEIIMPLTGWLMVAERNLGWQGIIFASLMGAFGNLIGASIAYWAGALGGRPFIEKYGHWILISHKDLDRADSWFGQWGELATFVGRLLPIVRTFISLPAGIARMNFPRFAIFTFVGSFLWCIPLTWAGYKWGPDWESFREHARFADYPIAAIVGALFIWFVVHRIGEIRRHKTAES